MTDIRQEMAPMTDDLRTRIIAALRPTHNGRDAEKCADAVIQELDNMGIIHLSKVRHDDR